MRESKWVSIDESFGDREEFLITEKTDVKDLVSFGNSVNYGLKIRAGNNLIYGRGYCTRDDGSFLFIGNYRLFVESLESSQKVKDFVLELLHRKLIRKKNRGE